MSNFQMKSMNFELTTECPLRCPQCYCTLNQGKHLAKETAFFWVDQAARNGVETLNLSGGETLCYPYLYDVISRASSAGINVNVALSGLFFNRSVYEKLIAAGICGIFISLNGSTEEINNRSRRGYALAVSAIDLLYKMGYQHTSINWVMQDSNADDFSEMILFAEDHHVENLVVMALKPDSKNELVNLPSKQQMLSVSKQIREYHGKVNLLIERCFSPMLALVRNSFLFGNTNRGMHKGCVAGLESLSLNVDGLLSPCRHIYLFEKWDSLEAYWNESSILNKIRSLDDTRREPCVNCKFNPYCRHCIAINSNVEGELFIGDKGCPLSRLP